MLVEACLSRWRARNKHVLTASSTWSGASDDHDEPVHARILSGTTQRQLVARWNRNEGFRRSRRLCAGPSASRPPVRSASSGTTTADSSRRLLSRSGPGYLCPAADRICPATSATDLAARQRSVSGNRAFRRTPSRAAVYQMLVVLGASRGRRARGPRLPTGQELALVTSRRRGGPESGLESSGIGNAARHEPGRRAYVGATPFVRYAFPLTLYLSSQACTGLNRHLGRPHRIRQQALPGCPSLSGTNSVLKQAEATTKRQPPPVRPARRFRDRLDSLSRISHRHRPEDISRRKRRCRLRGLSLY